MSQALSQLVSDFLSALFFLFVYVATGNIIAAAAIAIAAAVIQLGYVKFSGRHIEPMQWMSLGLVIVLSGASILTQSPRFVMLKPSIAHFAVAAVMLRRGWMVRYLPEIARQNLPESVPVMAGYAWAGSAGRNRSRQYRHRALRRFCDLGVVCVGRCGGRKDRGLPLTVRGLPHPGAPQPDQDPSRGFGKRGGRRRCLVLRLNLPAPLDQAGCDVPLRPISGKTEETRRSGNAVRGAPALHSRGGAAITRAFNRRQAAPPLLRSQGALGHASPPQL